MGFSTDSNQACPDQYRCRDRTAIALLHREAKYPLRDSYLYRCAQGAPEKLPVLSATHGILYGVAVKGLTGSILVATGVLFDREMRKVVRCARGTRTVVFPRTATGARDEAFSSSALRSAVVGERVELLGRIDGKDAWPARAGIFQTSMLARVSLPRTLRVLGKSVFKYCVALRRVCLPDSLTVIGPECFYGSELEEVAVPDAVETIGARAFYHCSWLRRVSFRKSSRLREIREEAFAVSGLEEFAVPAPLRTLAQGAFYFCKSLRSVRLNEGLEQRGAREGTYGVFQKSALRSVRKIHGPLEDFCNGQTRVLVEEGCALRRRLEMCARVVVLSSGATRVGNFTLGQLRTLNRVVLPLGLKTVGSSWFCWCDVEEVKIPASVRTLGAEAFAHSWLLSVFIPAGVRTVESRAFWGCERLEEVQFADDSGLRRVGDGAFAGTMLVAGRVRFPAGARVSPSAFSGVEE